MLEIIQSFRLVDLIDILIVSVFVYYGLIWFQTTRAFQLFKGLLFILLLFLVSKWLGMQTIPWLLQKLATFFVILIIVVFHPELRKALEQLGRHSIFSMIFGSQSLDIVFISEIMRAVETMSNRKIGAIIVIENSTGLGEYLESGVEIEAKVSEDLLLSIFQKNSPLHDGAVIIQRDKIIAARCLLPLTDNKFIDQRLGTRHRAAIGISELTDAMVIVVSEEGGTISLAHNGALQRYLSRQDLEEQLLISYPKSRKDLFKKLKKEKMSR